MTTPIGTDPTIKLSVKNQVAEREIERDRERECLFKHSHAHILHE